MYGKKPRSPVCPCLILFPQEYFWLVPMFWCCPSCWRGDGANICSLFAKGEHPSAPEIVVLPMPARMSQGRKRLVQGSHECYGLPKHIQQLPSSQRASLRLSQRAKWGGGKPEVLWILPCLLICSSFGDWLLYRRIVWKHGPTREWQVRKVFGFFFSFLPADSFLQIASVRMVL